MMRGCPEGFWATNCWGPRRARFRSRFGSNGAVSFGEVYLSERVVCSTVVPICGVGEVYITAFMDILAVAVTVEGDLDTVRVVAWQRWPARGG